MAVHMTDGKENMLAPNSVGARLPIRLPTIVPIQMMFLLYILIS